MIYGLWDEANDAFVASCEVVGPLLTLVRQRLDEQGNAAAEALVLIMEDDDGGLHYIASGLELIRMARAATPAKRDA